MLTGYTITLTELITRYLYKTRVQLATNSLTLTSTVSRSARVVGKTAGKSEACAQLPSNRCAHYETSGQRCEVHSIDLRCRTAAKNMLLCNSALSDSDGCLSLPGRSKPVSWSQIRAGPDSARNGSGSGFLVVSNIVSVSNTSSIPI